MGIPPSVTFGVRRTEEKNGNPSGDSPQDTSDLVDGAS
jgi:hypothetical protein